MTVVTFCTQGRQGRTPPEGLPHSSNITANITVPHYKAGPQQTQQTLEVLNSH